MSILIALAAGLAIGVALGLLGGGGSILAVPALVYLLDQDIATAVPTSLLVVGMASLTGVAAHARDGDVRWRIAAGFALPGVATSFAGAWVNSRLDQNVLLLVFAGLMVIVAVHMLMSSDEPEDEGRRFEGRSRLLAAGVAGAAVGFLTGLLGVGGGFLIVPALVLTLHLPMAVAVGTSLVVIVANSAAGFVANSSGADLDWVIAGAFIAGGLAGAIPGSRFAPRLDEARLRNGFAVFILAVAVFVVVQVTVLGGATT
ncbi:MAG: sulfite exporter TauE/SafE family protein [Acidimicrobiales bacterium]|nr:sulfite exporter TauE/SafE family protein [Acidimicrobiales bacterium]